MILGLRIRIVVKEVTILDELSDSINFELRVVHADVRVGHGDDVDLACHGLLVKERSLPHADTYAHLVAADMVECRLYSSTLLLNQKVEVNIDVAAAGLVLGVPHRLGILLLLELGATLGPRSLHLLDVVDHIARAWLIILLHSWVISAANYFAVRFF